MSYLVPVEYRIGRVAKSFPGYIDVFKILQIAFQRMANDFGTAAIEFRRRRIQRLQQLIGNLRSDLTDDELLLDGFDSDYTSDCLVIYHV